MTLGFGQNGLSISDGTLSVQGDFRTRTITFGGTLSGVYEGRGFEIWPALSFDFGHSNIGMVGLTGFAYGGRLGGLSVDAGSVSVANLTFEPEFKLSLDGQPVTDSDFVMTLAPRVLCEVAYASATDVTQSACGGGASLGLVRNWAGGLGHFDVRVRFDRLGGESRTGVELNFERRF